MTGRLARGLVAALALAVIPALAQTYPAKPIKFVVPFAPGTSMDILARTIAEPLGKRLGQPVAVENKAGASGNLGAEIVAKSPPDGYTLMITASTFAMTPALYKALPYDPVGGFAPVGRLAIGNLALVVNPALGVATVGELIAQAKRQPGKLKYASPGNGTTQHMAMEAFKQLAGIDIVHVPYKGSGAAVTDVMDGKVSMLLLPVQSALELAMAGKVLLLAVSGDKHSALASIYPTFREAGGAENLDVGPWYAMLAPARTPREVILRLQQEIGAVLALPNVRDALIRQGITPAPGTPDELAALIKADIGRWQKVAAVAKISVD